MKAGEVKIRLANTVQNLIDTYFGGSSINEKFINSTLKIILKQNLYKVDSILNLFTDQNGDININEIINEYSNMIGENGMIFDIKQYVNNDIVKSIIPDKVLIIKQEDLMKILS
jgi:hypothetical protein